MIKRNSNNIFRKGMRLEEENRKADRSSAGTSSGSFSSKGQMFVIAGLIMLIGFFLLRGMFSVYSTLEEKRFQETSLLDKEAENMLHEYERIVMISRLQGDANSSAITNLMDFSGLLRDGEDAEILYALVSVNDTRYAVTVGNFLGDNINMTVNGTNSTPASVALGVISDRRNATASFAADSGARTINITLSYARRSENVTELIPVRVSNSLNMLQLFLDAKLKSGGDFVRIKSTFNSTW